MRNPLPSTPPPSAPSARRGPLWLWLLLAAIALSGIVLLLVTAFPGQAVGQDAQMRLVHGVLWLVLLGSAALVGWRTRPGLALRQAAIWIVIGGVIFFGYSFRYEFQRLGDRLQAELIPSRGQIDGLELILTAQQNGHFVVAANVDGIEVRFLVDTGASDVVLTPRDARRLGFVIEKLNFSRRYATANGTVFGAPVTLDRVSLGPITVRRVRASVNQADMRQSLLGVSFLSRLSGYEVKGDKLILKP